MKFLLSVTLLLVSMFTSAARADAAKTVVLVHGAFADG